MPVERAEVLALVKQEIDRLGLVQAKQQLMGAVTLSVLQLALTGTKRKIGFGLVDLTFGGGTTTGVVAVAHGLTDSAGNAIDPQALVACVYNTGSSFATGTRVATWKSSATQFSIQGERSAADAPNGTVVRAAWVAIG